MTRNKRNQEVIMESIWSHYNNWAGVALFAALYAGIWLFMPFYRKMGNRPKRTYLAFVLAFAIEMHGIPFSMYLLSWVLGREIPVGVFWGHTLFEEVGFLGMYLNIGLALVALYLILSGWKHIHRVYWSREKGDGRLVTEGLYRYIRHPQYTGVLLLSLGMLLEWATIPMLLMFPV